MVTDMLPAVPSSMTGLAVVICGGRSWEGLYVLASSNLTAVGYWDKIFRPIVRPYPGAMSPGFLLELDNAWPRVAKVSWMMRALIPLAGPHIPQRLESNLQPQGLDLLVHPLLPNNTTDCPGTLIQVWKEIPQETIHCLIRRMTRCWEYIRANGGHTY